MSVRKNAKLLTAAERENFVRACVMMKADIVNPAAPAPNQYSRWDESVAIHQMIQRAIAPGVTATVNFGHGGEGSYGFLSWHRYFLYRFEQQLQSYVPGVMLPYWDWTDVTPLLTDTFLGPNGSPSTGTVQRGYFAATKPGVGANTTPLPGWWPAALQGWTLPEAFGTWVGALRRAVGGYPLPTVTDLQQAMAKSTLHAFQYALESGRVAGGISSGHQMHNGLHGYIGGHMGNPAASPFDPIFYLHHCNIDRLWAMWQLDGHANEFPTSGGDTFHHRNDLMYPWTGGAPGFSSDPVGNIPMPDFAALGAKRNVDTLDHRALGYTYDTIAIIGVGLDRTGSMTGVTPDPMTTGAPDVTKWEAVKRGVSAFLQDCETVYASATTYVMAGVNTFRSVGAGNEFQSVFAGGPPSGLVKPGGTHSRATFDASIATLTPGGGTPLFDALANVQTTLVQGPYEGRPAGELRYLAMLTDGLRTTGSLSSSIPVGSYANTAVFAMGFGTGADVDYPTLEALVAKGRDIPTTQVFHGENAGTIDKFYSNALASAIGFTTMFDPVMELFAGEHVHFDLDMTSAEEAVFITVQGMDFDDANWAFALMAPDGVDAYVDGTSHAHGGHGGAPAHGRRPHVTARRRDGRLSLMLQRDSADRHAWVGRWRLMIGYRDATDSAMVMPSIGALLVPAAAGPVRGPRYKRLLQAPSQRVATRNIVAKPRHTLDERVLGTNSNNEMACSFSLNVYARTRLRIDLVPRREAHVTGAPLAFELATDIQVGSIHDTRTFARLIAPAIDQRAELAKVKDIPREALIEGSQSRKFDAARVLGVLENEELARVRDEKLELVAHDKGPQHVHIKQTELTGAYHVGMYIQGAYCPEHGVSGGAADHAHGAGHAHGGASHPAGEPCGEGCQYERFTRLLASSAGLARPDKGEQAS